MSKFHVHVGDWSKDGHSQSDKILMQSNASYEQILGAYKASVELTGIDVKRDLCSDYEESKVKKDVADKLKSFGLDTDKLSIDEDEKGNMYLDPDTFAALWAWFVNLSLPEGKHVSESRGKERIPTIEIGGYGLYY